MGSSSKEERRRHSIEEALHTVDAMAIVDDDNIIDGGGIEVGSRLYQEHASHIQYKRQFHWI